MKNAAVAAWLLALLLLTAAPRPSVAHGEQVAESEQEGYSAGTDAAHLQEAAGTSQLSAGGTAAAVTAVAAAGPDAAADAGSGNGAESPGAMESQDGTIVIKANADGQAIIDLTSVFAGGALEQPAGQDVAANAAGQAAGTDAAAEAAGAIDSGDASDSAATTVATTEAEQAMAAQDAAAPLVYDESNFAQVIRASKEAKAAKEADAVGLSQRRRQAMAAVARQARELVQQQWEESLTPEERAAHEASLEAARKAEEELKQAEEEARLAAEKAAAEAERVAAAERQRQLRVAEDELHLAEDMAGLALDEAAVNVPRGLTMLKDMYKRLNAHVEEALGASATRRQLYVPPAPPPAAEQVPVAAALANAAAAGDHATVATGVEVAAAGEASSGDSSSTAEQGVAAEQAADTTATITAAGSEAAGSEAAGSEAAGSEAAGSADGIAEAAAEGADMIASAILDSASDAGSLQVLDTSTSSESAVADGSTAANAEVAAAAAAATEAIALSTGSMEAGAAVATDSIAAVEASAGSTGAEISAAAEAGQTADSVAATGATADSEAATGGAASAEGTAAASSSTGSDTTDTGAATAEGAAAASTGAAPAPPPVPAAPAPLPPWKQLEFKLDPAALPQAPALADGTFTLAAILASGIGTAYGLPHNDSLAAQMLHVAALGGSTDARLALADRYLTGRGVPCLPEVGLAHAKVVGPTLLSALDETGAISGDGGGQLRRKWMDMSYHPAGGEWQDENTLHFEQDLAARGDAEAHRQLGYRMLTGQGLPRDVEGAFREFQIAARGGDPYAMFNLGYMHIRGLHVPQNHSKAREHFLDAAAKKLPAALNGLGVLYFHGQGVPVDYAEARRYFEMAALQDHDAAYNLATIYQGAYGVERNMSMAIQLFNNATDLGSWRAPHQLMMIHADGLFGANKSAELAATAFWRFMSMTGGWKESGKEAAERYAEGDSWGAALRYAMLAEQGNPSAALNLAWILHHSDAYTGEDRHRLALGMWLRAAARNYSEGSLMAGHAFKRGAQLGLEGGTNITRAAELYQRAADIGSIEGMFSLARLREQGLGVQRNVSEALRLYRKAVQTAPYEAYAMAPFLALQWLRLRLLLAPLLRLLAACLPAAVVAGTGVGAGGAGAPDQAHFQQRAPSLPAQWDTLLIAAMVGVLTWVLWRKRQLQQQRAAAVPVEAEAEAEQPAASAAAAAAIAHQSGSGSAAGPTTPPAVELQAAASPPAVPGVGPGADAQRPDDDARL